MSLEAITLENSNLMGGFSDLRSVKWRINLGVLPSSVNTTIDDLRRVTADSRRRYARLRRRLLIDPHVTNDSPDLVADNPLSQNPDSTWGRFFRNAELEKMVDKDLSRLYPEHGSYFQTSGCQGLLRRILLLWCLRHPECGYRQGMHELLAPLIYVLHADIQHLIEVRKLHEDHFVDKFDEDLLNETIGFTFKISSRFPEDNESFQDKSKKHSSSTNLDTNLQSIVMLSDPYGVDSELGIVLSEKFMEHDAYCMFDALMSGSGGDVAMSEFFSHSPTSATHTGLPPVIEASLALYHLLSVVDPSLYSHLIELGVEPQYFALRWLRVLFGREFSLEDLLIIWDEIFSFSNTKSITSDIDSVILNSPRGAFICAMAVSMILNVRSSLLATEIATSCLQRLLNFPEEVDLDKLMQKAKSLVPLALDAKVNAPYSAPLKVRGHTHSLSLDSRSLHTPVNIVPERYWEEKWRLLQKEEETKKGKSIQQAPPKKRGWTEKLKSKLSRTESDPALSRKDSKDRVKKSSVRRSLLEDLSRQLNAEEDTEESKDDKIPLIEDSLDVSSDLRLPDSACEEHFLVFSDPTSPLENISENSSITSNLSHDIIDCENETQKSSSFQSAIEEQPLPISDNLDLNSCGVPGSDGSFSEPSVVVSKVRKTLSEKFQWLWKFGRHNSNEGNSSDKKIEVEDAKSCDGTGLQENKAERPETSVSESNCDYVNLKGTSDKKIEIENGKSSNGTNLEGNDVERPETSVNESKFDDVNVKGTCSDNKIEVEDEKSCDGASLQQNKAETSASKVDCDHTTTKPYSQNDLGSEIVCDYASLKIDGCDQNLICVLRNLGQSMLENIQVIESAFGPERQAGLKNQLSKHALVDKGQVTATTALKELRKISNLLRDV